MANAILKKISFIAMLVSFTTCASQPPKAPVKPKKGDYGHAKAYMTWFIEKEMKDDYLAYPPGTIFSYSNLGVTLLGHAVEVEYPLRDIPAGGLNTTAIDLARLAMLVNNKGKLENHQILAPESLDAMFAVQNDYVPLDLGYQMGLAWLIDTQILAGEEPVFWHNGGTIAHRSAFMVAPKSGIGAVVLAGVRVAPQPIHEAWKHRLGHYEPLNPPEVFKFWQIKNPELKIEDNFWFLLRLAPMVRSFQFCAR